MTVFETIYVQASTGAERESQAEEVDLRVRAETLDEVRVPEHHPDFSAIASSIAFTFQPDTQPDGRTNKRKTNEISHDVFTNIEKYRSSTGLETYAHFTELTRESAK